VGFFGIEGSLNGLIRIGRRYIRFFKFLDSFSKAYDAFSSIDGMRALLMVGKWGCMGIYLGCESLTIVSVEIFCLSRT
jgi:hypothetical protein